MTRDERIRSILRLLRERRATPIAMFLETLEVSRATIKRDLEILRDRFGVPVVWDRDRGGYRLDTPAGPGETTELPGLWFSADEIHALITADYLLERLEPGLLAPLVQPLRERLQALAADGDRTWAEVTRRIRVLPMFARATKGECFAPVARAVLERRRLHIRHFRRQSGEHMEREVSPQRLVHYRDNWYLDAWCHLRKALRTFSVDAIREARVLETKAREVADNTLDRELGAGYGIFSGAEVKWARLAFTPERARWVSRETWHPEQKGRSPDDGSYVLEVPYSDQRELIGDILRHGDQVEVLAPKALRDAVADAHRSAAGLYD